MQQYLPACTLINWGTAWGFQSLSLCQFCSWVRWMLQWASWEHQVEQKATFFFEEEDGNTVKPSMRKMLFTSARSPELLVRFSKCCHCVIPRFSFPFRTVPFHLPAGIPEELSAGYKGEHQESWWIQTTQPCAKVHAPLGSRTVTHFLAFSSPCFPCQDLPCWNDRLPHHIFHQVNEELSRFRQFSYVK